MTDQDLAAAVSLALNPEEGRPFSFGGREFRFQFLTYDGEQRLIALLMPRIAKVLESGKSDHAAVMTATRDLLPEAVAIILADYGEDVDLAWVRRARATKGQSISQAMYDLVAAQFEVNDLGKLLSGTLQADALLRAASRPAEA